MRYRVVLPLVALLAIIPAAVMMNVPLRLVHAPIVPAPLARPVMPTQAPGGEPIAAATRCLAEAVYFEARGTSAKSRAAVAHVVVNRALSPDFPDTVCAVVRQGCQFSYNCDGKPEVLADRKSRDKAMETARAVLADRIPDPTDGALFYHGRSVKPDWSDAFQQTSELGGHIFYRY
ncbi:MAG: cell wall hydrolase [Rhodobacteraceae bacterium]|nr:cell wall hydrolase [Paracoccaceae bacterium]